MPVETRVLVRLMQKKPVKCRHYCVSEENTKKSACIEMLYDTYVELLTGFTHTINYVSFVFCK